VLIRLVEPGRAIGSTRALMASGSFPWAGLAIGAGQFGELELYVMRGGTRPGAGRPKGKSATAETVVLSVRMPREWLAEVDRLAAVNQMTRQEYVLRELGRRIHKITPR